MNLNGATPVTPGVVVEAGRGAKEASTIDEDLRMETLNLEEEILEKKADQGVRIENVQYLSRRGDEIQLQVGGTFYLVLKIHYL